MFTVSNDVKQGGILSPRLLNVYMDVLSVNLNKLQIGCLYAGAIMNHMMYADDLCVFFTFCCAEYGELYIVSMYLAGKLQIPIWDIPKSEWCSEK